MHVCLFKIKKLVSYTNNSFEVLKKLKCLTFEVPFLFTIFLFFSFLLDEFIRYFQKVYVSIFFVCFLILFSFYTETDIKEQKTFVSIKKIAKKCLKDQELKE